MDAFRFTRHEWATIIVTTVVGLAALYGIQILLPSVLDEPWRSIGIILLSALALFGALVVILRLIGAQPLGSLTGESASPSKRLTGTSAVVPAITQAPRDPKWEQGDQLTFEGLALLDEIRKGGDRQEQSSAWLDDVREFLRTHNPTAWKLFDAPTGMLPFRSSGYPQATVELATAVDRALYLIRLTNPRVYGRAHIAQGGVSR